VPDWLQIFVLYRHQLKKYQGKLPVKRGLNDMTSQPPHAAVCDLKLSWRVAQSAAMLTSSIGNRHNVLEAMHKHEGLTF
jgi:hypothetical protein